MREDSLRYDGSSSTGAPGFDAGASMSRTKAMWIRYYFIASRTQVEALPASP